MDRDTLERFIRELLFGTRDRALVSYLGGAVLLCLAIYGVPIALMVYVFGMTFTAALGVMSDLWMGVVILYVLYRLSLVVWDAWTTATEEAE